MTPPKYAEGTDVPVERSRAEIESLLKRHGASAFFSANDEERGLAQIGFRLAGRLFRVEVKRPRPEMVPKTMRLGWGAERDRRVARWVESEERRRWRAQLLLIKAKLEMVATGETTVEREFLADMLMADGATVGQRAIPALARAYETGSAPQLPMLAPPVEDP